MRRAILLALSALLGMGASPALRLSAAAPSLGYVPPSSPRPDSEFQAAPVPDPDISDPARQSAGQGATFRPGFFHDESHDSGQGYVYGSTIQRQQQQREKPIPGFSLQVPLQ